MGLGLNLDTGSSHLFSPFPHSFRVVGSAPSPMDKAKKLCCCMLPGLHAHANKQFYKHLIAFFMIIWIRGTGWLDPNKLV